MRRIPPAVVYLVMGLAANVALPASPQASGPRSATAACGRFQLAILAQDWVDLGEHYDWEAIWPSLQAAAAAKPLLVIDERDVEAYDWAAQRIVLRPEVTPRFLRVLQRLHPKNQDLGKLKELWDSSHLIFLTQQGFLVSFDGQPVYGGVFLDKISQMSIRFPVIHSAVDPEHRIVLRFSPIHYPFGSLWGDGSTGDALDSPVDTSLKEVQDAFGHAFPEVRTPEDHLGPEDQKLVARFKGLILDPRFHVLFEQLGVPAQAPRHPVEIARRPEGLAAGPGRKARKPLVALNLSSRGDDWQILVDLGDPKSVAEILIRSGEEVAWRRVHPDKYQTRLSALPEWLTPGRHRIEVKLVDSAGVESAPYIYWFDPEHESLLLAKQELRDAMYRWAELGVSSKCGGPCLDFSTAFRHRDALREIRYSFGGCALDRRFPFEPWTALAQPPTVEWEDKTGVPVAPEVSRACVQLVYRDGEKTEPQVYDRDQPPESSWRLAEADGAAQLAAPPARNPRKRPGSPSPVSLRAWRYTTGWEMAFDHADPEALSDILYRFDGEGVWMTTGLNPRRSPRTGRYHPNTIVPVSPRKATPGRHRLEVRLVTLDGRKKGPYTLEFDPQQQVLAEAKSYLNDPKTDFAQLTANVMRIDNTTLSIGGLLDRRDALREIRYSIDSRALDQRIPFKPWDDLAYPPAGASGDSFLHFPKPVSYACFQLVYRDGETAAPRCFSRQW